MGTDSPLGLLRRLRDEQTGVTIIEALVSAVVVAIVSLGALGGLDGARGVSDKSRLRSVAASLAQADQERLRGMRAEELSKVNAAPPAQRQLRGKTFRVQSSSAWVTDAGATPLCTANSRADFLKITSTVTWLPDMGGIDPVKVTSLVTPSAGSFGAEGAVGVTIGDRNGAGLAGIPVSLSGPENVSGTTNAEGCIFFGYLRTGSYTLSFSKSGYADPAGRTNISDPVTVASESTSSLAYKYDRPGSMAATVKTRKGTGAPLIDARAEYLSVAHGEIPAGLLSFGNGTGQTSYSLANLFPFSDPYSVFSGNCRGANPALSDYATPAPAAQAALATVPAGAAVTPSPVVREPSMRFIFRYGSGTNEFLELGGATVKLTAEADGCGGTRTHTTDADGWLDVPDAGVPVGVYDICVQIANPFDGNRPARMRINNLEVKNPDGEAVTFTSYEARQTCP